MDDPVGEALAARLVSQHVTRRTFLRGAGGLGALAALGGVSIFLEACANAATGAPSAAPSTAASVAASAAASASASAAASGSAWPSAAPSPSLGGALNFIGYDGEDAKDVAKAWLQQNNIKMNPTFIVDAFEPLTRFKTGAKGQMDIISDNKDFQRVLLAAGVELYQPLDLSRIPNAAGLFPAFQQAPWLTKNGQMYGIPLIWGDEPCVYNPKKWSGVPAKYTDFSDPKYKGELVLADDPVANTWLFAKSIGMPQPNRLTQAQLDQAIAAMKTIKPNVVTFSATLGDQADVLIRGDASMAIGGWAYQIVLGQQKGVTLASASPSTDGTYYWSDAYGIAVGAPHADNAYAFINFIMAPENNAAVAKALGSGATIAAAVDQMDAATKGLYHYDLVSKPGGILATQVVSPPQNDEGDIVGIAKWQKAWQDYKLA